MSSGSAWLSRGAAEQFCYLTTTGRRTGRPHTIEIWFAVQDGVLYLLAERGDRSDWVRNLRVQAAVEVRLGAETRPGRARVVDDPAEADRARRAVAAKYEDWREGEPLEGWVLAALPVAVDFPAPAEPAG